MADSGFEEDVATLHARGRNEVARSTSLLFAPDESLADTLNKLACLAVTVTPPAAFATVTMVRGGGPPTTGVSGVEVGAIEDVQHAVGEGPTVEAVRDGRVSRVASIMACSHWPQFASMCRRHGVLSAVAIPLAAAGEAVGAVTLYAETDGALGHQEERAAQALAGQLAVLVANAAAYWEARRVADDLAEAMETRAVIEQAKGVIMASTRSTPDEAFDLLMKQSQHQSRTLRDVARDLVSDTSRRR